MEIAMNIDHDVVAAAVILRFMQMHAARLAPTKVVHHANKYRSSRCYKCANCLAPSCGECIHCRDSPRYGGPGIKKQTCLRRACSNRRKPVGVFGAEPNADAGAASVDAGAA
jgi:CXXC zinc finger domain